MSVDLVALLGNVEHFQRRVLQDALHEATAAYWLRRAATFDAVGNDGCAEVARACRNRAAVALLADDTPPVCSCSRWTPETPSCWRECDR